jgi:alkaline phosphatase
MLRGLPAVRGCQTLQKTIDKRSNPLTENPSLAHLKNHHSRSLNVNKNAFFRMMMY